MPRTYWLIKLPKINAPHTTTDENGYTIVPVYLNPQDANTVAKQIAQTEPNSDPTLTPIQLWKQP